MRVPDVSLELEVPEGTAAVVLLARNDDGDLVARYAESRGQVPAPRAHVITALLELAFELDTQRKALEAAENGETP
jgi:hypothetical protein